MNIKNIIYKRILKFNHSQAGSVLVVVALSMIVLFTMFAFVIDTGYLYGEKNKFQNGVEAAAMAGAVSLCDEDPEGVARQVAIDNGLPAGSLVVKVGFYDEKDLYQDFSKYKDFVAENGNGYPDEEYNNAVMVKLNATGETLMGGFVGKDEVNIGASAVAYLKRYGMVSLADDGEIRINTGSMWKNGDIFANGDIKHPQKSINPHTGSIYPLPEFTDSDMFAACEILECPVTYHGINNSKSRIDWDRGTESNLPNAYPGSPLITEIRPIDDAYVEEFRNKADKVYNINSNRDNILYDIVPYQGRTTYYFDLSGDHGPSRTTYFFDAAGDDTALAMLVGRFINHPQNGNSITNITFAANCRVSLYHKTDLSDNWLPMPLGGEGDQQAIILSSKDIKLVTGFDYEGVIFLSGGNFLIQRWAGVKSQKPDMDYKKMRVIANGSIGSSSTQVANGPWTFDGAITGNWDFLFGPPCPPNISKLGRLELSASN